MKIKLDKDNYIEINLDNNKMLNLSILAQKNELSTILVTAKLNSDSLDDLITALVSLKTKVD